MEIPILLFENNNNCKERLILCKLIVSAATFKLLFKTKAKEAT
jgi:hypothetical protein